MYRVNHVPVDGTGGESIWGGEFEDEIVKSLKYVQMQSHLIS